MIWYNHNMKRGFTLVEVLIVMALLGILASIAIPNFSSANKRGKETTLRKNLHEIRDQINYFYLDKKKYPSSMEDLVVNKYLRQIPYDPIARTKEWTLVHFEPEDIAEFDSEALEGFIDIKSTATGTALDGSKYSEW